MVELTGGANLAKRLAEIAEGIGSGVNHGTVRVGFLAKATYPDGKSVALIAALNNWGTKTAPPRPFFTNMIADKSPAWGDDLGVALKLTDYNVRRALDLVGANIAGQLRQSIIDTNAPPNAPSTIAKKGHSKPLVDTGHMLNSVDHEVTS